MLTINFFGLLQPPAGAVWLFTALTLLLLLLLWLQTVPAAASRLPAALPAFWLYLALALITLLAVWVAATLPALLLTWSLLLLAWTAVSLSSFLDADQGQALPGPQFIWRSSGWLWGPLACWGAAAAVVPLPEPLYAPTPTLPVALQIIMALGLLLPLVCWPLWGRRSLLGAWPRPTAVLLLVWPAVAAAGVLARFVLADGVNWPLLGLLLGLAALLIGLTLLWPRLAPAGRLPLPQLRVTLPRLGRRLYGALYDALLLLEGEVGLLWLLALLVLALMFN
ncbi:MAG: hypothetical protein R6X32_05870 [Chloroflexota bacterium]